MFGALFRALFGTKGERDIKKIQPLVDRTNAFEEEIKALSDDELRAKTPYFKEKLQQILGVAPADLPLDGEENEKNRTKLLAALDEILPEAFAVVRETAWRTIKQRPYDVQVVGGIVLHQGKIAEMKTGEGKTLAATMPVYLNALTGLGAHVVTVNDYLARRDAEWMGPVYHFLGLSVGYILTDMDPEARQQSYGCDITYGTNNEFGFDYLRDNMALIKEHRVQRKFYFCIVDEVDSILIDEARTPLIISGAAEESTRKYHDIQKMVPRLQRGYTKAQDFDNKLLALTNEKAEVDTALERAKEGKDTTGLETRLKEIEKKMRQINGEKRQAALNKELNQTLPDGDFVVDEEDKSVFLTPEGIKKVEQLLHLDNLYSNKNIELVHHVEQALRANHLYKRDVDYVVKDGEVMIVDEFTGRLMPGRRWSDGLHQAVEAKERVHVERENQTLATITFQNYFRMYPKLSGMTGTADTEAEEFKKIYKLDVVVIPTNKPLIRKDHPDRIYRTEREKFQAIAEEIEQLHKHRQPVLVGTISVEKSEKLSRLLKNRGVPHNVLNAKFHEMEAEIVAQAGAPGKVTIATNMAGRGTDIVLGGNPEFQGKQLVENLLKNKHKTADNETITEFVRLVNLGNSEQALQFAREQAVFDRDMVDKVETIRSQCKQDQQVVLEAGGLHILGTERHEARRIDNQLRGRAGRQGDPGSSRFYISMEDDLMRLFGGERLKMIMQRLKMQEGEAIEHPLITRALANSQRRVEARNFEIRKHLIKYDEVMNEQRTYVYNMRNRVLEEDNLKEMVEEIIAAVVEKKLTEYSEGSRSFSDESLDAIRRWIGNDLRIDLDLSQLDDITRLDFDTLFENLVDALKQVYARREQELGEQNMRQLEKAILLDTIDNKWKEHLYEMDFLKEGINWRSYAERDPLVEYKREGFALFHEMEDNINSDALSLLFVAELTAPLEEMASFDNFMYGDASHDEYGQFGMLTPEEQQMLMEQQMMQAQGGGMPMGMPGPGPRPRQQVQRRGKKVGRNEPCPCGSGKKYKHCCYPKYE